MGPNSLMVVYVDPLGLCRITFVWLLSWILGHWLTSIDMAVSWIRAAYKGVSRTYSTGFI